MYYDTNSNSFKLSTSSQNNINFFTEGECPTVVVLGNGWNWWTPVKAMTLGELETALGGNSLIINSQDGGFVRYENNTWSGTLDTIMPGQMYRILTTAVTEFVESGETATSSITLMQGYNWFGYTGAQPTAISTALGNLTPTDGDTITAKNGDTATYSETTQSWVGELETLVPGHGYVYHSNASQSKTITLE